jgi:hypothetical protein
MKPLQILAVSRMRSKIKALVGAAHDLVDEGFDVIV